MSDFSDYGRSQPLHPNLSRLSQSDSIEDEGKIESVNMDEPSLVTEVTSGDGITERKQAYDNLDTMIREFNLEEAAGNSKTIQGVKGFPKVETPKSKKPVGNSIKTFTGEPIKEEHLDFCVRAAERAVLFVAQIDHSKVAVMEGKTARLKDYTRPESWADDVPGVSERRTGLMEYFLDKEGRVKPPELKGKDIGTGGGVGRLMRGVSRAKGFKDVTGAKDVYSDMVSLVSSASESFILISGNLENKNVDHIKNLRIRIENLIKLMPFIENKLLLATADLAITRNDQVPILKESVRNLIGGLNQSLNVFSRSLGSAGLGAAQPGSSHAVHDRVIQSSQAVGPSIANDVRQSEAVDPPQAAPPPKEQAAAPPKEQAAAPPKEVVKAEERMQEFLDKNFPIGASVTAEKILTKDLNGTAITTDEWDYPNRKIADLATKLDGLSANEATQKSLPYKGNNPDRAFKSPLEEEFVNSLDQASKTLLEFAELVKERDEAKKRREQVNGFSAPQVPEPAAPQVPEPAARQVPEPPASTVPVAPPPPPPPASAAPVAPPPPPPPKLAVPGASSLNKAVNKGQKKRQAQVPSKSVGELESVIISSPLVSADDVYQAACSKVDSALAKLEREVLAIKGDSEELELAPRPEDWEKMAQELKSRLDSYRNNPSVENYRCPEQVSDKKLGGVVKNAEEASAEDLFKEGLEGWNNALTNIVSNGGRLGRANLTRAQAKEAVEADPNSRTKMDKLKESEVQLNNALDRVLGAFKGILREGHGYPLTKVIGGLTKIELENSRISSENKVEIENQALEIFGNLLAQAKGLEIASLPKFDKVTAMYEHAWKEDKLGLGQGRAYGLRENANLKALGKLGSSELVLQAVLTLLTPKDVKAKGFTQVVPESESFASPMVKVGGKWVSIWQQQQREVAQVLAGWGFTSVKQGEEELGKRLTPEKDTFKKQVAFAKELACARFQAALVEQLVGDLQKRLKGEGEMFSETSGVRLLGDVQPNREDYQTALEERIGEAYKGREDLLSGAMEIAQAEVEGRMTGALYGQPPQA